MSRLDPAIGNIGIGRLQAEVSLSEIAGIENVNQILILQLWNSYNQSCCTKKISPEELTALSKTPGQDRYVRVFYLWNRAADATATSV